MLHIPVMFLVGGAVGLLARPVIDERRERKRKEEHERLANAIVAAMATKDTK
jgi:hypothetical protein